MARRYRFRGLTLGEVVVLVVMLGLLAGVVTFLCHHRLGSKAFRMTCGTNLSSLGKAMAIYANDYRNEFPCAGGPAGSWIARTPDWEGRNRFEAYGMAPNSQKGGRASISASLYLLVKYTEVTPKTFVCKQDKGVTEFTLSGGWHRPKGLQFTDVWDFGPEPPRHVSYAYHTVYNAHKLTTNSPPGRAVASDRNPWIASPFGKARDFAKFQPDVSPFTGTTEAALQGNAIAHEGYGQNVLFVDGHVEFANRSFCSIGDDNIYTSWKDGDKVRGNPARFGSVPADPNDLLLVNDPATP